MTGTSHRDRIIARVTRVRDELGPLMNDVMLVGGSVPALYDLGPVDVRETEDVDLVIRGRWGQWAAFLDELRARRFQEDPSRAICRMSKGDLAIDVMPDNEARIGANRWYEAAYDARIPALGGSVRVVSPIYFVATKFEAFRSSSREHAGEAQLSRDVEDIIRVLRGVTGLLEEAETGRAQVHRFIRHELLQIANDPDALTIIQGHLEGDVATQQLARPLWERLRRLTR